MRRRSLGWERGVGGAGEIRVLLPLNRLLYKQSLVQNAQLRSHSIGLVGGEDGHKSPSSDKILPYRQLSLFTA